MISKTKTEEDLRQVWVQFMTKDNIAILGEAFVKDITERKDSIKEGFTV